MKTDKTTDNGDKISGQPPQVAVTGMVTATTSPRKKKAISQAQDNETNVHRLLSVKEAATYLRVSPWTVRSLGWSGEIPEVRIGRRTLFDREDLDRFIERSKRKEG